MWRAPRHSAGYGGYDDGRHSLHFDPINVYQSQQPQYQSFPIDPKRHNNTQDATFETTSEHSCVSPTSTGSMVSLDERYYQFTQAYFSEPVMVLNPKRADARNRHKIPAIVVCTQEGRTGSPVENWMAPLGADDSTLLMVPEHECGLTEDEEMQIALDQEQWEREEEERRREERRRMRAQRRQQRNATSSTVPAKKKKRRGRHPEPQHTHHHVEEREPTPSSPQQVSHLVFPNQNQSISPSSNYRPCSTIPQTVAELTSPRGDASGATPRETSPREAVEKVPFAGYAASVTSTRENSSSTCAESAPLGTLKRGGSLTSWSVRQQTQPAPSPQQLVSSGAMSGMHANSTTPPVVSKPVHREIVRMQSPSWAPMPAPPPQLPPAQGARSMPPSPKREEERHVEVPEEKRPLTRIAKKERRVVVAPDAGKYVVAVVALLGGCAGMESIEHERRIRRERRALLLRKKEVVQNAGLLSAVVAAACGARTAALSLHEQSKRMATQGSANGLVALVAAIAANAANHHVVAFRTRRLELKQQFVQKRLMEGRETSARIRIASLEAEERANVITARDAPPRVSPAPQPEVSVPLPVPQTQATPLRRPPTGRAVSINGGGGGGGVTPVKSVGFASSTPKTGGGAGSAFKPSLFKAEGFSLTFADMGRISAASPLGSLPLPNSESRLPRPTLSTGPPPRMPFDSDCSDGDSDSETNATDTIVRTVLPACSPVPAPCVALMDPDVPTPMSPSPRRGLGSAKTHLLPVLPTGVAGVVSPPWREVSTAHSADEMMEIVSCVEERSITPPHASTSPQRQPITIAATPPRRPLPRVNLHCEEHPIVTEAPLAPTPPYTVSPKKLMSPEILEKTEIISPTTPKKPLKNTVSRSPQMARSPVNNVLNEPAATPMQIEKEEEEEEEESTEEVSVVMSEPIVPVVPLLQMAKVERSIPAEVAVEKEKENLKEKEKVVETKPISRPIATPRTAKKKSGGGCGECTIM